MTCFKCREIHDDVIKWKHFARYWSFVMGVHRLSVDWIPSQRAVTQTFEVFFHLRLNKRLSKQSRRRWFETPSSSLWSYSNEFSPIPYSLFKSCNALWLPAWWALRLLWWSLTAMVHWTYWYIQCVSVTVSLLYFVENKSCCCYYYYYYYY